MVPKGADFCNFQRLRFGAILFDMVPKDKNQQIEELESFGTILFVTTLNAFSVFIFIKIWHTIIMNKVDKIERRGGCSFFLYLFENKKISAFRH